MNFHAWKPKLKPSTKFFAKARPAPGGKGFNGQFSAPGLVPDLVGPSARPAVFPTEDEAELAAYRALEEVLNARLQMRMRFERLQKMSAAELSAELDAADLTPTELGYIVQSERVMGWLDGTHDVPHMVRIIVGLCRADPKNIEQAEAIAAAALTERSQQ